MNGSNREQYYEETDFSGLIKPKGRNVGATAKRITLNISGQIYDEANELDSYMRMGYQNVLKTAMTIGLTALYNEVSRHKIDRTSAAQVAPLRKTRKSGVAKKPFAVQ